MTGAAVAILVAAALPGEAVAVNMNIFRSKSNHQRLPGPRFLIVNGDDFGLTLKTGQKLFVLHQFADSGR